MSAGPSMSYAGLIILAVFGAFVLGGIALLAVLLANKRTRPIGYVLLAVPIVLVVIGFGWFVIAPVQLNRSPPRITQIGSFPPRQIQRNIDNDMAAYIAENGAVFAESVKPLSKNSGAAVPAAPSKQDASGINEKSERDASDKNKSRRDACGTSKSVIRALSTAFAKTVTEFKDRAEREVKSEKAARNTAEAKPADTKPAEAKSEKAKPEKTPLAEKPVEKAEKAGAAEISGAEKINQMVEVLSGAVRKEVPDNIEVDQFTALRALGKLLGRLIVSEQQEEQAAAEAISANHEQTQKTSAVAGPAVAAGSGNEPRPDSQGASGPPPAEKTSASERPAWVDAQPSRTGDAYQVVVVAGPYTTRLECDQAMPEQLYRAVDEYAELYLGDERGRRVGLSDEFLRKHVIVEQWEEQFQSSVGPMVRLHARLIFDTRTNSELKERLRRAIVSERLAVAGCGLAAILLLLSGCFGALRLDNATAGRYRGRMAFAVVFGTVMTASIVGTRSLIAPRTAPVALETIESNTTVYPVQERNYEVRKTSLSERPQAAAAEGSTVVAAASQPHAKRSILLMLVAMPLLCLTVGLMAFKKTRAIAFVLVFMGVAVALGALLLIS